VRLVEGNTVYSSGTMDYGLYLYDALTAGKYPTRVSGTRMVVHNNIMDGTFTQRAMRFYSTGWNGSSGQELVVTDNLFRGHTTGTMSDCILVTGATGSTWKGPLFRSCGFAALFDNPKRL